MTTSDPVKCWIDSDGIVWSHDCDGNVSVTPALAIPLPVVEKVREALTESYQQFRILSKVDNSVTWEALTDQMSKALSLLEHTP